MSAHIELFLGVKSTRWEGLSCWMCSLIMKNHVVYTLYSHENSFLLGHLPPKPQSQRFLLFEHRKDFDYSNWPSSLSDNSKLNSLPSFYKIYWVYTKIHLPSSYKIFGLTCKFIYQAFIKYIEFTCKLYQKYVFCNLMKQ